METTALHPTTGDHYGHALRARMKALGIGFPALSARSGVSVGALKRLLSGKQANPTLNTLRSVCASLGVALSVGGEIKVETQLSVTEFREIAARAKAEKLAKLVQGTSALESQAVGLQARQDMVARTIHELLAGSPRRLWAS